MKVKQGQTIYMSCYDVCTRAIIMKAIFLYSRAQKLPPHYCVIEKMPVQIMRLIMDKYGCKEYFHSRRKALTEYNKLKIEVIQWKIKK